MTPRFDFAKPPAAAVGAVERVHVMDFSSPLASPTRTADGFLRVDAVIRSVGPFPYGDKTEWSTAEENAKAAPTFDRLPLYLNHPAQMVKPDNAVASNPIGAITNPRVLDDGRIAASLAVWDAEAIAGIESRETTQLSCGYTCRLADENGQIYQRDVIGNHAALLAHGRHGTAASVKTDNATPQEGRMDTSEMEKLKADRDRLAGELAAIKEDAEHRTARMVACLDCNGGGRCDVCGGAGTRDNRVACDACYKDGGDVPSGKCASCSGRGKVKAEAGHTRDSFDAAVHARADLLNQARNILGRNEKFDGVSNDEISLKMLRKLQPKLKLDAATPAFVQGALSVVLGSEVSRVDAARRDMIGVVQTVNAPVLDPREARRQSDLRALALNRMARATKATKYDAVQPNVDDYLDARDLEPTNTFVTVTPADRDEARRRSDDRARNQNVRSGVRK